MNLSHLDALVSHAMRPQRRVIDPDARALTGDEVRALDPVVRAKRPPAGTSAAICFDDIASGLFMPSHWVSMPDGSILFGKNDRLTADQVKEALRLAEKA